MMTKLQQTFVVLVLVLAVVVSVCSAEEKPNLVPVEPGDTPNYCCTWAVQNYMHGIGAETLDLAVLEGAGGAALARANINEENIFGTNGWARNFYSRSRADMFLVLDDGWDVPLDNPGPWYSSFILSEEKFPSYAKLSPAARLKKLNADVRQYGWRGVGLWLAASESRAAIGEDTVEEYWLKRMRWCKEAGIQYWKVDWGNKAGNDEFRKMLTDMAARECPDLIVEHCVSHLPFNPEQGMKEEWYSHCVRRSQFSDVVRLYDLSPQLSVPAMLERVSVVLEASKEKVPSRGLLNVDDEPYIAAVLGACIGVLRHPITGMRPGDDCDVFFNSPRHQKKRMNEVARAVLWHRIAPAWAVGTESTIRDEKRLVDSWLFKRGDFWYGIGRHIKQTAPARVSRGMSLPEVSSDGEQPYVISSVHPNGAVSVATLGRISNEEGWREPLASVVITVPDADRPIGVFGHYKQLTIKFKKPLGKVTKVWAQDLLAKTSVNIISKVKLDTNTLVISGELIDKIGIMAGDEGDISDPGLVLRLEK